MLGLSLLPSSLLKRPPPSLTLTSSPRCLRTEQESVLALLGELVAAVGKLPTTATPVAVPTQGGRRKEGDEEEEDGGVRAAYRA
ncbi:hypothetical protein VE02_09038 [Pseudogymnoascus sp. 03VT05]|nr:hypothetical protein VE02_09038 [Pseudogymnoascus sp. 03VT05]